MKKAILFAAGCFLLFACNNEKKDAATTETTTTSDKQPQSEITDLKYTDLGKGLQAKMASGDVAGWLSYYADTATYRWNNGDSLIGKAAITDYWTHRRKDVIDSLSFSQDIWLPVKVNKPQQKEEAGVWLLGWYMVTAKYKAGKSMTQWTHTLMHFNSADKIDRVLQFLDHAPINAALGK